MAWRWVSTSLCFRSEFLMLTILSDNRTIFCYTGRNGATLQGCNPFEGSPFKPFWHHLNITTFMSSTLYQPLQVNYSQASQWRERFKSVKVIAFVGAPSAFPTNHEATLLQKHVQLSNKVATLAKAFQEESGFLNHVYVGVHLRHGSDWENACKLLESEQDMKVLFSSQQCTNDLPLLKQEDSLPYGLCLPPKDIVIKDIGNALKLVNRTDKALAVYIATDSDDLDLWDRLTKLHPSIKFITPSATYKDQKIYYHTRPSPIIDIYLLTYSDYFIGNCISSFSAFCSRQRLSRLKLAKPSTSFFALNLLESPNFETTKTELWYIVL